jgi:hypothetical protein
MAAKKQARKERITAFAEKKKKAPHAPRRSRPVKNPRRRQQAQSPSLLEMLFKESKGTPARREKSADV